MEFEIIGKDRRLAKHDDFDFPSSICDIKYNRPSWSEIIKVPGGWLCHNVDANSQSMCFVPFPQKYVYKEEE